MLVSSSRVALDTKIERFLTIHGSGTERSVPTTTTTSSECANNEAYWDIKQLRSSDEAPTELYICTACAHTWRRD